jgi:hypothetical protein
MEAKGHITYRLALEQHGPRRTCTRRAGPPRVRTRLPPSAAARRDRGAACEALTLPGCRARSRNCYRPPPRPRSVGGPVRRARRGSASDKARPARTGRA